MDRELSNAVPGVLTRLLVNILCNVKVGNKISKIAACLDPSRVLYKGRVQKLEFSTFAPNFRIA